MNWLIRLFSRQESTQKETENRFQAFILEPILTPSALIDFGGEDAPDLALLEGDNLSFLDEIDILEDGNPEDLQIQPFLPQEPFTSGTFEVGATGEIAIDFLYDGGKYKGELAIFSLEGMEEYEPGSPEFIQEAANRALSDTEWGHIVISDREEGARFAGNLGEGNFNQGEYQGAKTFQMRAGDKFGIMLVPNGEVEQVFENPNIGGSKTPLFSLSTANPNDSLHWGQIADITGDGQTFVFEDVRFDSNWYDKDYNDIIFQVRGARGEAPDIDEVIADGKDWRDSDLGQEILEFADIETDFIPVGEDTAIIEIISDRPDLTEIVIEAVNNAADNLETFSQQPDFLERVQFTFGEEIQLENVTEAVANIISGQEFPRLEILTQSELGSANAAYGIETNTIYLSQEILETHAENPQIISNIILEELGHYLDVKLETDDTPGDEGAIFARVVQGIDLDDPQLQALQQESDRLTLTLNGETITAELNGTGLRGEYYNREDFGQPQTSRIDPNLNFLWGLGTPAWGSVGADRFSIRWTGWLEAPSSETYDLTLEANGRSRIWLQNPATGEWHKLLDTWNQGDPSTTTHNITIPFPLQQSTHYPIKIEYQDDIGEASLNLKWESPSRPQETIPSTYLHPGEHPLPNTTQTGTGLKVKHYHHPDFGLLGGENNQNSQILHDWGNQGSIWSVTPPDGHSSIWTGRIEAPTSETYQFHTHADGRTRVWIKDQQGEWHKILEGWEEDNGGIRERTGTVPFEFSAGNQYEIKIEYQDDTGNSSIETLWESPSRSPEVIPTQFLYADDLSEEPGVQAQGTGPKANYYLHQDFSQKRFTWQENEANRDWGGHSPSYLGLAV
ncbi:MULTISPECIES: PA14 domain-containing protein [Spirulina sp. CCY15215]|uniref:PA14 domain-containing protein n=1 Tax=Spirulina sp. CCY15215 TaxID=2767591 RepID=UPI00194E6928|nr:PA14 domain-containing protein [Spirulina major]